jgi:multiple sugar transport system substrate-binding protein
MQCRVGRIATLLMALAIAACTGKREDVPPPGTITFWHFWSEPRQEQALKELVVAFEKSHPSITVQLTPLSWNEGKTKLLAAFNSGTAPDVVELGSDWVAQFSSGNVLLDLTSTFGADTSRFIPYSLIPSRWRGALYCAPWVVDTRVMFYNKELMARVGLDSMLPPSTWEALERACTMISAQGGGVYGFGANAADAHRLYKKVLPFLWANGGDVLSPDGSTCVINSARCKEALTAYLRLTQQGMLETQRQLDAQFASGHIGFWLSGGWLADRIARENPGLRYGVTLMPQPAPDKGSRASFAGGEYLAVTRATRDSAAAVAFVKFMTDGANAVAFCKRVSEAGYPADARYMRDSAFLADPIRAMFIRQLNTARLTPVHPRWLDMEKVIEDEVVEAMYGRKSSDEALDDAQKAIEEMLGEKP